MNRWSIALVLFCSIAAAAQNSTTKVNNRWNGWEPFLGSWQGTGTGQPGQGVGEFTFEPDLQGTVLIRHNFADYPATKDKPAYRHDDLMVIYSENDRTLADYWDNEGHIIHYDAALPPGKLVFTSSSAQAGPRFRLTYAKTGEDTLNIMFEIAPPDNPGAFKTYIEASARRKPRR